MLELKCDGSCVEYSDLGEHSGEVVRVYVEGWGYFNYSETAIAEDRRRGLVVLTEVEDGI